MDCFGGPVKTPTMSLEARGEARQQYVHAVDVVPTLYDLLGIEPPEVLKGFRPRYPRCLRAAPMATSRSVRSTRRDLGGHGRATGLPRCDGRGTMLQLEK